MVQSAMLEPPSSPMAESVTQPPSDTESLRASFRDLPFAEEEDNPWDYITRQDLDLANLRRTWALNKMRKHEEEPRDPTIKSLGLDSQSPSGLFGNCAARAHTRSRLAMAIVVLGMLAFFVGIAVLVRMLTTSEPPTIVFTNAPSIAPSTVPSAAAVTITAANDGVPVLHDDFADSDDSEFTDLFTTEDSVVVQDTNATSITATSSSVVTTTPAPTNRGSSPPPAIDCQAYQAQGVNMSRFCRNDHPDSCCQDPRSNSNYCHENYALLGDDVQSACHHCCLDVRNETHIVGEPNEPKDGLEVFTNDQCAKLVDNTARICRNNSCCNPKYENTNYCQSQISKHGYDDWDRICWYCCHRQSSLPTEDPTESPT